MNISFATIKELAGAVALVGGLVAGAGFYLIPPWAARADVEAIQKTIVTIQSQQQSQIDRGNEQNCTILQLLKDRYEKEQRDAQEELNKNPLSGTLQRARDEAATKVTQINAKLSAPPCT